MDELSTLGLKWGTDKVGHHEYLKVYDELLQGKRLLAQKVLEIGIGHALPGHQGYMFPGYRVGASLFMWQEYFPKAMIYAFDIEPSIQINQERICSFVVDQSNVHSLYGGAHQIGGDLDLIVDDGSHVAEHQITSAQTLLPFLNRNGMYIIEDIHVPTQYIIDRIQLGFNCTPIDCPSGLVCECGCGGPEKVLAITRA
jgi:hypothetical protein